MKNLTGARFAMSNGAPLTDLRDRSRGQLVASNGELNATDKRDLMQAISRLIAVAGSGQIVDTQQQATAAQLARQRNDVLVAAQNDPAKWAEIGVAMAAEISEANAREGFLPMLAIEEPISQGQDARIRVRKVNVVAVVAVGPGEIRSQTVRDKYFYPTEFSLVAYLEVENRDLARATGDVLDEKYQEGLQALMVQKDRLWKAAADAAVSAVNTPTTYSSFTPQTFAAAREQVTDWNIPVQTAIIANNLWSSIATSAAWQAVFSPVEQSEVLLTGTLGTIHGTQIRTDGFRREEQRVLQAGEFYVVSSPEYHASFTSRGGPVPTPINGALHGRTTKGWVIEELFSFTLANPASVAKGYRA